MMLYPEQAVISGKIKFDLKFQRCFVKGSVILTVKFRKSCFFILLNIG